MDPTNFTVFLLPAWWIFIPSSKFLPHQDNFTPNTKIVRNTRIIANTDIIGGKIYHCRCQELDSTNFAVFLVPAWWIIIPSGKFLPHQDNFTPNIKIVRNSRIIANTNISVGGKIYHCRGQELDPTNFTVLLVPTGWIFIPSSKFLPHQDNFTPNTKIVRNTRIIANTNISVRGKIYHCRCQELDPTNFTVLLVPTW